MVPNPPVNTTPPITAAAIASNSFKLPFAVSAVLTSNTWHAANMFAACQVFEVNTADTAKGNLKELEAIAAAVIGGVVLTGGFGTIGGIILGTIIFGIAKEAFFYIPGIDGSFYRVFLGAVLVTAALTNENIRKRIMGNI